MALYLGSANVSLTSYNLNSTATPPNMRKVQTG